MRPARRRAPLAAAGLAAALMAVVAACGEPRSQDVDETRRDQDASGEAAVASDLVDAEFTLVEGLPDAPAPGERTWVRFGQEGLRGSGGCNELGASDWSVEGSALRIESLHTTDMFCGGPAGDADGALADLLKAEPAITLADDVLTLETREVAAVFERMRAVGGELAGEWTVVGVRAAGEQDPSPPAEHATLELAEDHFTLDATCALFSGEVVVDGDQLHYRPRSAGPRACDSGDRSVEALSRFVSGTVRWEVEGNVLTITESEGDALHLSRR